MLMEYSDPFNSEGRWLKGNLHTHSTNSDGVHTPQEVVNNYRSKGYDFLSITDHGRLTDPSTLNTRGITLIPGEEISLGKSEAGTTFHIVAIGICESLPFRDFDTKSNPQAAIDTIKKNGGLAILAHPYWSGLTSNDMLRPIGYDGVEIYNSNCEIYNGAGDSRPHVDSALAKGRKFLLFATDDHHGTPEPMKLSDAAVSWISVKAKDNSAESILSSIKAGQFYASNGPEIRDITYEGDTIVAKTSPSASIGFISTPSRGTKYWSINGSIMEAAYKPRKGETYIRVEATDERGRTAWSNPIYLTAD